LVVLQGKITNRQ